MAEALAEKILGDIFGRREGTAPQVATFRRRITALVTCSLPANTSANAETLCTIVTDPTAGPRPEVVIPPYEYWRLVDVFVTASPSVDGFLRFYRDYYEMVVQTSPASTLIVSNPSRPIVAQYQYPPGSRMTAKYVNLTAVGASAVTVTLYAVFDIYS